MTPDLTREYTRCEIAGVAQTEKRQINYLMIDDGRKVEHSMTLGMVELFSKVTYSLLCFGCHCVVILLL